MINNAKSIITKYFDNVRDNLYHISVQAGILKVIVDSEKGITISDCAHHTSKILDLLHLQGIDIELEVTSPGIDRKLYTPLHYNLVKGSLIKCSVREPVDGMKDISGLLIDVTETSFTIELKDKKVILSVDFVNVSKANVDA